MGSFDSCSEVDEPTLLRMPADLNRQGHPNSASDVHDPLVSSHLQVNRGAFLGWLSQYKNEREILIPVRHLHSLVWLALLYKVQLIFAPRAQGRSLIYKGLQEPDGCV